MSKLPWSTKSPRAPHVQTPRAYGDPGGAILSPKQFKGGRVMLRHRTSLGQTSVNISRRGVSYSTRGAVKGLPSISTSRRGTRQTTAMGQGFSYRRQSSRRNG